MDVPGSFQDFWQQMTHPQQSEEEQKNSELLQVECKRLCAIAQSLLAKLSELREEAERNTVRREFASGCRYLHRGFYCPSPVLDKIMDNAKRGRILKRPTAASKPTHEYGFDRAGRMLWCNTFADGAIVSTEYLSYKGGAIYGLTTTFDGHIESVTEELFNAGRLIQYSCCVCYDVDDSVSCIQLEQEQYHYNGERLNQCQWQRLGVPPKNSGTRIPRKLVYQKETFEIE